ncbi:MAG TPA: DUF4232 domain-containing protein [Gaiellaceae bacterium]|jgi:hypothetical protein
MIAPPKPPSHDDLEALIKEARERQLRRRLLGAAGIAIVAALGLSIYAFTLDRGASSGGTRSAGAAAVSVCRSHQLVGTTFLQAATMSGVGPITITNVSDAGCVLPSGMPSIRITWHGSTLAVQERTMKGRPGQPVHLLRPGATAAVPLVWSNWCGRPQGMVRRVFYARFPNGLTVRAPEGLAGHPDCGSRSAPSVLSVGRPFRS